MRAVLAPWRSRQCNGGSGSAMLEFQHRSASHGQALDASGKSGNVPGAGLGEQPASGASKMMNCKTKSLVFPFVDAVGVRLALV